MFNRWRKYEFSREYQIHEEYFTLHQDTPTENFLAKAIQYEGTRSTDNLWIAGNPRSFVDIDPQTFIFWFKRDFDDGGSTRHGVGGHCGAEFGKIKMIDHSYWQTLEMREAVLLPHIDQALKRYVHLRERPSFDRFTVNWKVLKCFAPEFHKKFKS